MAPEGAQKAAVGNGRAKAWGESAGNSAVWSRRRTPWELLSFKRERKAQGIRLCEGVRGTGAPGYSSEAKKGSRVENGLQLWNFLAHSLDLWPCLFLQLLLASRSLQAQLHARRCPSCGFCRQ